MGRLVKSTMATDPPADLPPDKLFLQSLPLIKKVIAFSCRTSRFRPQDAEDFESWVMEKLIEGDYRVLREFQGRCSLGTYLSTVIQRLGLDFRNHLWGKWRPSAEAERLGKLAVRLEELLFRDGYTFEEACQILRVNEGVGLTVAELADLRAKLPPRTGKHQVGDDVLQDEPSRDPLPDQLVQEQELESKSRRIRMALHRALETLSKEKQLLVKLRTRMSVANIARAWEVDQKPLYRRLEQIYKELRKALEREGVRREDVEETLRCFQPDLYARPKKKG